MTPLALDIAIGIVIFISTMIAYFRGFVKEVFTLGGIVAATFLSYKLGHLLVPEFNKILHVGEGGAKENFIWGIMKPELAAKVFSFGGTFLFVFLIVIILGYLITRWIKEAGLGVIDRLLGAFFGFFRGFLLVFLLYVPCTYLIGKDKFPDWAKNSFSVPVLQSTLDWANKSFELDKKIESRDGGISIKVDKVDIDKFGEDAGNDLKAEISKEESEIKNNVPHDAPANLIDKMNNATPPNEAMPAPQPQSAPPQEPPPPAPPEVILPSSPEPEPPLPQ